MDTMMIEFDKKTIEEVIDAFRTLLDYTEGACERHPDSTLYEERFDKYWELKNIFDKAYMEI